MKSLAIGVDEPHFTLSTRPWAMAAFSRAGAESGVKSRITPPPGPAACTSCRIVEFASVIGSLIGKLLRRDAGRLCDLDHATVGVRRDRVRRGDDERLRAGADERLRGTDVAVARAHVRLDEVRRAEALRLDAGADHGEALGLVVLPVRPALGEARVADDADDLVALDELLRERALLRRVELLVVERVLDRVAVDAAVVVDALEVRRRRPCRSS